MNVGVYSGFDYTTEFEETARLLHEAEFTLTALGAKASHSGHDTREGRVKLKEILRRYELKLDFVHAPLPECNFLLSTDEDERRNTIERCKRAIEAADDLDGRVVVTHVTKGHEDPAVLARMVEEGRKSFAELVDYCVKHDVKLALENSSHQVSDDILVRYLSEFDSSVAGLCYDSGHEHFKKSEKRILNYVGDRLLVTHLHDNAGDGDSHMLPWEGTIDWGNFRRVIRDIGYKGDLVLEADIKNSRYKPRERFLERAMECLALLASPL